MDTFVCTCAAECKTCQLIEQKGQKTQETCKNTGKVKPLTATKSIEQNQEIFVEVVGPLPIGHSGNRYIVSIISIISEYCMLVPVESRRSGEMKRALDRWTKKFGTPISVFSENELFHSQSTSSRLKAERLHRWLKEHLRLIANNRRLNLVNGTDDWSNHISIIQRTHNRDVLDRVNSNDQVRVTLKR